MKNFTLQSTLHAKSLPHIGHGQGALQQKVCDLIHEEVIT